MSFSLFASILIIFPCAIGFTVLADPILKMLYPSASDGALILQLSTIPMIFIALNHTLSGGLYGLNLSKVPAIALSIGIVIKTILNIILIRNPNINIAGAVIGSISCQAISFTISYRVLKVKLNLKIDNKKILLKPAVAAAIMGIIVYISYNLLHIFTRNTISTIMSILIGIITYLIAIIALKVLSKEDMLMLPFGSKIYNLLIKLNIYKEKSV